MIRKSLAGLANLILVKLVGYVPDPEKKKELSFRAKSLLQDVISAAAEGAVKGAK